MYNEYEYISQWLCLPGNFFKCKIYKSKEKEIVKHFLREKRISGICELFANTSHVTNIIPIPIRKFWNSQTIPIPICTEIGSANLFLFLFAGKITFHLSLHSVLIAGDRQSWGTGKHSRTLPVLFTCIRNVENFTWLKLKR